MSADNDYAIALDIGGTMIKAGLMRRDGKLLALHRRSTPATSPPEDVVREILDLTDTIIREGGVTLADVRGIGVSIACFITADGVVTATAHLSRQWLGYNLKERLRRNIDTEYYFALDSPAPTLGEAYYGAGVGHPDFVYITVSTGIGGGIIAGGRFFAGGMGWAGGVGHTIIDARSPRVCSGCGNHGCLETFAATQGIVETAHELADTNPGSLLSRMRRNASGSLTPRMVFEAAQESDPPALEVWRRAGHALGIGLVSVTNIVSPTRIVVGGGIAQAGDFLLEPARQVVRECAFPPQHRACEIVQSALGDLSGLYGAAAMVFNDIRIAAAR